MFKYLLILCVIFFCSEQPVFSKQKSNFFSQIKQFLHVISRPRHCGKVQKSTECPENVTKSCGSSFDCDVNKICCFDGCANRCERPHRGPGDLFATSFIFRFFFFLVSLCDLLLCWIALLRSSDCAWHPKCLEVRVLE